MLAMGTVVPMSKVEGSYRLGYQVYVIQHLYTYMYCQYNIDAWQVY